jgi:hypothetical protein
MVKDTTMGRDRQEGENMDFRVPGASKSSDLMNVPRSNCSPLLIYAPRRPQYD